MLIILRSAHHSSLRFQWMAQLARFTNDHSLLSPACGRLFRHTKLPIILYNYCKTGNFCVRLIFACSRTFGWLQKLNTQIFICSLIVYTLAAENAKIHFRTIISQTKMQRLCSLKFTVLQYAVASVGIITLSILLYYRHRGHCLHCLCFHWCLHNHEEST